MLKKNCVFSPMIKVELSKCLIKKIYGNDFFSIGYIVYYEFIQTRHEIRHFWGIFSMVHTLYRNRYIQINISHIVYEIRLMFSKFVERLTYRIKFRVLVKNLHWLLWVWCISNNILHISSSNKEHNYSLTKFYFIY